MQLTIRNPRTAQTDGIQMTIDGERASPRILALLDIYNALLNTKYHGNERIIIEPSLQTDKRE